MPVPRDLSPSLFHYSILCLFLEYSHPFSSFQLFPNIGTLIFLSHTLTFYPPAMHFCMSLVRLVDTQVYSRPSFSHSLFTCMLCLLPQLMALQITSRPSWKPTSHLSSAGSRAPAISPCWTALLSVHSTPSLLWFPIQSLIFSSRTILQQPLHCSSGFKSCPPQIHLPCSCQNTQ